MNKINGHQYADLGYSHEELKELLSKINKGKVLTPAQHDMLINTIKIENISTFSGEYDDLKNTPDIPKIVNDIIRSLNLASNDAVGTSLEAIKDNFDNVIKTLNQQKANVEHTHTTDDIIGINDMLSDKADVDHYHDIENIMGLNDLINNLIKDKADIDHTHTDFYTKSEVNEIVNEAIAGGDIDLSGYVTNEQLQDYATKESIEDFVTLQELLEKLAAYVTLEKLAEEMKKLPVEDHTHQDILDQLNNKADVDSVYNKDEIDDMLKNIDLEGGIDTEHNHDDLLSKEEAENTYAKIDDSEAMIEMIGLLEENIEQHKADSNNTINSMQTNLTNKINITQEDLENQISNLSTEINAKLDNKADKFHSHDTYYSKSEIDTKLAQLSTGGSIDLEGYLKQEDVLPLQEDIDKLQQDVANKADANHTHSYKVSDIEGLQEALDSKVNTNDSIEIPDDIMSIINNKADKDHTHDFAPVDHTHESIEQNISNLQNELNNKAEKSEILSEEDVIEIIKDNVGDIEIGPSVDPEHTHDEYAPIDHNHDEVYAPIEHDHEGYALEEHNHEDLAPLEHAHEEYALDDHTHTEFASKKHDHAEDYAPLQHIHDYAAKTHIHEEYADYDHDHKISDIENLQATLDRKLETGFVYTKEEIDKKLVDLSTNGTIDLEGFIGQTELAAGLATKADLVHGHSIDEIDNLQRTLDRKANMDETATKDELQQVVITKADLTHGHDIEEIDSLAETLSNLDDLVNAKADKATAATKEELAKGLIEKSDTSHTHDEDYAPKEHEHEEYCTEDETREVATEIVNVKALDIELANQQYTNEAISELTKDAPEGLNNFVNIANKIVEQDNTIKTVKEDVYSAMANMAPLDHTHDDMYATVEGENEREIFNTTELTVSALGGIPAGANLNGLTVKEILNKLLYPYLAPTISVAGTPNGGVFEKGNNQTITNVKVVVTKKSEKITKIEVLQGSNVLASKEDTSIADGGTFNFTVNVPVNSTNITLTGKVTDAQGTTRTATTGTFNFVYPYYVGVCGENDTIDETLIKSLDKRIEAKGQKAISYTVNQQRMIIAYPKSYGTIRRILDANSFDVTNTFTRTEIKITGLDGTSQSYYVYANNASTVSGFTMTFSY